MTFDQIKDQLQTGDVVLFNSSFESSKIIETVTGFPFSHSAMVVRMPDGALNMWEATPTGELTCQLDQTNHPGARLVDLETVTREYAKNTYWKTVFRSLVIDRTTDFWAAAVDRLSGVMTQFNRLQFPTDPQMLLAYFEGKVLDVASTDEFVFCSELVAKTYMTMGLLAQTPVANSYAPGAFCNANESLALLTGALGGQLEVDWPQAALLAMDSVATGPNKFELTPAERR